MGVATFFFFLVARVYSVPVCARRGLFSAEAIQAAQSENRKMEKKKIAAGHPSRGRARGMTYADGDVNSLNGSLTDHARTREARRRPFTEAEVTAWRKRIFAETMDDPVKVAVEEAVKLFGSSEDFTIWAWYANRIGVNNFLELYFEQRSVMRYSTLRNPAAAFHMRLKRFYNARFPKGGVA